MIFRIVVLISLTLTFLLTIGEFTWQDAALGAGLSLVLILVFGRVLFPQVSPQGEFVIHILVNLPQFFWMLGGDILRGTWQVTEYVIGRKQLDHPGIVAVPLGNHTRQGSGIVGLCVTLSPGSFLLDIDWEHRLMLIHVIDASDPDAIREDVEKYYRLWEYGTHIPIAPEAEHHA